MKPAWLRFIAWTVVLLCCFVVYLLVRSPWGRLLRGIREDEDAIRSLGKNVFAIKMQALIIGGLFGALGGMMYVMASSVQPDSMGRTLTFFCYTALLLGGAATIFGPVLGAILTLALNGGSVATGVRLLSAYSMGLAIPFLIAAMGVGWVTLTLRRYGKAMHYIEIGMGVILVILGVMLFAGVFERIAQAGQFFWIDFGL